MDWQLRIALIIAGCGLIGYVYYDYTKKKRLQKENEKLKKQFGNISDGVDSTGFDNVGVGTPRPASVDDVAKESNDRTHVFSSDTNTNNTVKGKSVEAFIENTKQASGINEHIEVEIKKPVFGEAIEESLIKSQVSKVPADDSIQSQQDISDFPEPDKAMVFSLILQAPRGTQFKGRDFLPLLLSQGLRHGEMGIFHRRIRAGKDPGPVLFSLANGIAPGTFDIHNMENFETPALACFVTLPGPEDAQVAYNAMYKTCTLLQQELGGDLLDDSKSVYSEQTHNHRLDQIKDYSFKFGV
jgi:cell division protein ZipA